MRTRQLAASLALLGMLAAGCATPSRQPQPTPANPGQALTAARGKTLGARTARFRGMVEAGGRQTMLVEGVIDFARGASQQTTITAGLGGATTITAIFLPDVTYTKDPRNTPKGAKPWLKTSVSPAAKQTGMTPFGVADPRQALDFLYGAANVTDLGSAVVRGTPTRHWRTTVSLADVVAKQTHEPRARVLDRMGAAGALRFQVDVWVDDQGRVRKVVHAFPSTTPDRRGGGTITMEYFDFGAPVHIVLPPASQVAGDHY